MPQQRWCFDVYLCIFIYKLSTNTSLFELDPKGISQPSHTPRRFILGKSLENIMRNVLMTNHYIEAICSSKHE